MSLHRKNESRFEFHVNVISMLILNEGLKAGFDNRSTTKCANSILVLDNNKNIHTHFIQFEILRKTKPSNTIMLKNFIFDI